MDYGRYYRRKEELYRLEQEVEKEKYEYLVRKAKRGFVTEPEIFGLKISEGESWYVRWLDSIRAGEPEESEEERRKKSEDSEFRKFIKYTVNGSLIGGAVLLAAILLVVTTGAGY